MNTLLSHKQPENEPERAYCKVCGSVFFGRSWHWNKAKRDNFEKNGLPSVKCPACYKIQNDLPGGILSLIGVKDKMKLSDMVRDVKGMALDSQQKEPLSRVIRINEKTDEVVIYTTEAALAKKIGRHLTRTYAGSLSVDDSTDKLARVVWISKES